MRSLPERFWIISRFLAALLMVLTPLLDTPGTVFAQGNAASGNVSDNNVRDQGKSVSNELDKTKSSQPSAPEQSATKEQPAADAKTPAKQPLQGYAKEDSKGTPAIPEWKLKSGYDEVLGIFYVGLLGFKLHAMNGPMGEAVLGKSKLEHWKGHKPHPCLLKFTKMTDDTGGYYFRTVGSEEGPRGWILPQPVEPHKPREWAIYYMQ